MNTKLEQHNYARALKLIGQCKEVLVFKYAGELWLGERVELVKQFCKNEPIKGDFYVWLQDNCTRLIKAK